MYLKSVELTGFKSFGKKVVLTFGSTISAIVGPNGSGKSNVAEGFRFVLGEQSMKSLRSKRGEDLIWGGSPALPRMNRAGVKVVFDNSPDRTGKRLLDLDFQEVSVERVVHRDGQNEYLLNGSQVRLKDIIRLLAGANIGGSGYQIISQGEADRILTASPKERREMVEDALGLKLYQHKKAESERQLQETKTNLDKVRSLRREITPHLNFLRVQVEKIEKSREMKEELAVKLTDYLAREDAYITQETARTKDDVHVFAKELKAIEHAIEDARRKMGSPVDVVEQDGSALSTLENERLAARREREEAVRELGRAEAAREFSAQQSGEETVSASRIREFIEKIELCIEEGRFDDAKQEVSIFKSSLPTVSASSSSNDQKVAELTARLEKAAAREDRIEREIMEARSKGERVKDERHEAERIMLTHEAGRRDAAAKLAAAERKGEEMSSLKRAFDEEVREGVALIGAAVRFDANNIPEGALSEERSEQEKRRRQIERLKIKIEESGAGNSEEVMKEYTQTMDRDAFLAKEVGDLESSAEKLEHLISELEETMDEKFHEGLVKINDALSLFFSKLFGGGEAKLKVEEPRRKAQGASNGAGQESDDEEDFVIEEDELYAGLSISVSLPRKKVRGLEVLSGGERALTSIALIFSMSQVNPPPFLILDETDAALDEANSKRYADMIQELSKHSQLIVITHNRATMSAAGELYGVTMDNSGVSKILSVKLEEAEKVAK